MPDRASRPIPVPLVPVDPMDIISFSPVVPYDGIPHAGGAYVHVHLQALLAGGHHVTLVAPDSEPNRSAAEALTGVDVELVGPAPVPRPDLRARLRPAMPPRDWEQAVVESAPVRRLVESADLLEFQWTQTAHLHRGLSPRGPLAPAVCVAHDVVSQLARRQAGRVGVGGAERTVRAARALLVLADERATLRRMTATVTFSRKDADLLVEDVGVREVRVVAPPLEPEDERWSEPRRRDSEKVVFVGAFDREENADAAHWLLGDIWPRVLSARPSASLHLVGANPTPEMQRAADLDPSVLVSGYAADLVPWYASAAVVVVPLRQGAGVKFKTVTALLWGVPVVSTAIGVEGIAPADSPVFAAVTDDAARFADEIVRVLGQGDGATSAAAREFATARYGRAPFFAAIDDLYRSIAAGAARA